MRYVIPIAILAAAVPASAATTLISISGTATTVNGTAAGNDIALGDKISLSVLVDRSTASLAAFGPDPTQNLYSIALASFAGSVGSVILPKATQANLSYWNNRFGMDGITFVTHFGQAGPFGSSFANLQFGGKDFTQNVLASDSIGSGFPLSQMEGYFFLSYGGSAGYKHIFGTVSATAVDVPAVPEPFSWAMMLAGFGMIGSAMRASRRKRQPASVRTCTTAQRSA